MKFTVSWWDQIEGLGVAISEGGTECILHRSNISAAQAKNLKPRMIIHGEAKRLSGHVFIIQNIRTSKQFESKTSFRKLLREVAA